MESVVLQDVNNTESTLSLGSGRGGLDDCEGQSGEARLIVKQQGKVWDDEGQYSVVSHVQKAKTFGDKDLGYHPIVESDVYFYIV